MVRVPVLVPALAVLVQAFSACSSRPSQDSGPLALKPPFADPVIEVGAAEAPDAPLKRDIAFLEDNLMSMRIIEKCIGYLIKGIREDGAVPDRVQADGRPVYAAGSPETPLGEPNIDNAQFLVFAVSSFLDMVPADRHQFLYFPPISRLWHALKLLEIQDQRPLQNSLSSRLQ